MRMILILLIPFTLRAQIQINPPTINGEDCPITDTVWVAPWGSDLDAGSYEQPVRSISRAAKLLPFGIEGIRNGHAWGLIMLAPGSYDGYQQTANDWKKGNTYKNISLEGIDHHPLTGKGFVTIGGSSTQPFESHALRLQSDHSYVKNIRIRYAKGNGVLVVSDNQLERRVHDVRLLRIDVDTVGNFGILATGCDRIEVLECKVLRSAQFYNDALTSPCQWPSGLKVMDCAHAKVALSHVGFSRGEGINFHNCLNAEAFNNQSHDNTTNVYNDNTKNLLIHANYIYNTDEGAEKYWRGCPQDTGVKRTPSGILIANEGACNGGSLPGPVWDNCRTRCSTPTRFIANVDSMFIFNNVFQNVGNVISFWEGSTQIIGINCIRNVFVYHNTSIGTIGNPLSGEGALYFYFPSYNPILNTYGRLENIQIYNNIFSFDATQFSRKRAYQGVFAAFHPSSKVPDMNGNLWNFSHSDMGSDDTFRTAIPATLDRLFYGETRPFRAEDFQKIIPCPDHYYLNKAAIPFAHTPQYDINGIRRNTVNTNVGALEYREGCFIESVRSAKKRTHVYVYPNPVREQLHVSEIHLKSAAISILNLQGRKLLNGTLNSGAFDVSELPPGIYWIRIGLDESQLLIGRFVKY